MSVLLPAQDCSQTHTLLCLSYSPCKSLAMHCFGGSLPLPSRFQCVRADQDRGRQAGRQEHASSSVQLGAEPCRSLYCSTDRGIVWGQRKPQKMESLQRSLSWGTGCVFEMWGADVPAWDPAAYSQLRQCQRALISPPFPSASFQFGSWCA